MQLTSPLPALAEPLAQLLPREVLAPVMEAHGRLGAVRPMVLSRIVGEEPGRFLVLDARARRTAVVAVSPADHPRLQLDAARRASAARRVLGPRLSAAVLVPWHVGDIDGVYFAVTPYHPPLSERRPLRRLQRLHLRGHLLQWLHEATVRTVRRPTAFQSTREFLRPLRAMVEEPAHSERLRVAACETLDAITHGIWQPRLVLAHNDLWEGNVLRADDGPFEWSFALIDWGGSRVRGHAIYDLVRLASSFGLSSRALARQLALHAQALGCAPAHTKHHLVAALAWLASNLDEWPLESFAPVADHCLERINQCQT